MSCVLTSIKGLHTILQVTCSLFWRHALQGSKYRSYGWFTLLSYTTWMLERLELGTLVHCQRTLLLSHTTGATRSIIRFLLCFPHFFPLVVSSPGFFLLMEPTKEQGKQIGCFITQIEPEFHSQNRFFNPKRRKETKQKTKKGFMKSIFQCRTACLYRYNITNVNSRGIFYIIKLQENSLDFQMIVLHIIIESLSFLMRYTITKIWNFDSTFHFLAATFEE